MIAHQVVRGEVKFAVSQLKAASSVEVFVLDQELLHDLMSKDNYLSIKVQEYLTEQVRRAVRLCSVFCAHLSLLSCLSTWVRLMDLCTYKRAHPARLRA